MIKDYIDALCYYKMSHSNACWKGNLRIVSHELDKLSSATAKYTAIKENIHMRVKGIRWEEFKIGFTGLEWSKLIGIQRQISPALRRVGFPRHDTSE